MPRWIGIDQLKGASDCAESDLHNHTSTVIRNDLTIDEDAICNKRYTVIAEVLPYIADQPQRNEAIAKASQEHHLTTKTIRKMLCQFLAFQDKRIFAPPPPKSKELTQDEKNIRWALNKFYYTRNGKTLTDAYTQLIRHKYCDADGNVLPKHPSMTQFTYFYRKTRKLQTLYITRDGLKNYQMNKRPLLGNGVQEFAPAVGVGMADSTTCDIYLCDDSGTQLVGRPILTAIVDAYSGLCYGYSLGWSHSLDSIRELLLNCLTDKVELCKRFGIEIQERDWNCTALPAKLLTDRGNEYASYGFAQLTELGISITNLPAYRAELKGSVERFFGLIQGYYKHLLRGKGVIEADVGTRGAHDYRQDACLNLRAFEAIILHCIVHYNRERILANYPYTQPMLDAQIPPHPSDVWNYGLAQAGANLITVSKEKLIKVLLPRTKGTFTQRGLIVNKIRYRNDAYTEQYLSRGSVTVAYNPDDVSQVYLVKDNYAQFDLIESRYEGLTLDAAKQMMKQQKELILSFEPHSLQAKVDLTRHIQSIVNANKHDSSHLDIRNASRTRANERYSKHKNLINEVITNERA
jgi:transposase InsO family protein